MIIVDARSAIEDFRHLGRELSGSQVRLAVSRAINRSIMQGRTVARRIVSSQYNISQRSLSAIDISKSTASTLKAEMRANAKPIPLSSFSPKFETPTRSIRTTRRGEQRVRDLRRRKRNPGKGVTIEVYKGKREVLPFAFMTPSITAVFARGQYTRRGFEKRYVRENATGNDLPIQAMLSVSIHTSVLNPASRAAIKDKITAVFPQQLRHEINYRLSRPRPTP